MRFNNTFHMRKMRIDSWKTNATSRGKIMSKGGYEKGFGTLAVEKRFLTEEQLIEGMEIQIKEEIEERTQRSQGTILKDLGYLTVSQVNEILKDLVGPPR